MWTHTPVPAYIYIVLPLGALKSQLGGHIVSRCCFISSTAPVIIFGHVYIYVCVFIYLFIDLFGCLFFVYLIERERQRFILIVSNCFVGAFCTSSALHVRIR